VLPSIPMGIRKFQPPPTHKINTPEPIHTKNGTIDYVHDGTRIPNLVEIHPLGILSKWVK